MFFRWPMVHLAASGLAVMVLGAAGAWSGEPIPAGKDAYTAAKYREEQSGYKVGLVTQYDKHTTDGPEARDVAKAFSKGLVGRSLDDPQSPTWEELDKKADGLLAAGEADPLVLSNIGMLKMQVGKTGEGKTILTKAHEAFGASSYPSCWKFRNCNRLRTAFMATATPVQQWQPYRDSFVGLIVENMAGAADEPKDRRFIWQDVADYVQIKPEDNGAFAQQTAIYELVKKAEKMDPWMQQMVLGWHYFAVGWRFRGEKTVDKISEENLQVFAENLKKAAGHFTKAWELDPKIPDAPTMMIRVLMGIGSDGSELSPRDWFDRAVKAQLDFLPAYNAMVWALTPRWGGSHREMYEFARECAATKRYDTCVPEQFTQTLLGIDSELGGHGDVWRRPGVFEIAKAVFEGIENEPSRRENRQLNGVDWTLTTHFLVAAQAQQFDEAGKILDKLGDKICSEAFPIFALRFPYDVARVRALTGKSAEDAREFDATVAKADYRKGEQLKTARERIAKIAAAADPGAQLYLDYWKTRLRWEVDFDKGQWVELTFDKALSMWQPITGEWTAVDDRVVSSTGKADYPRQRLKCLVPFGAPFEVECDVDFSDPESGQLTGILVGDIWSSLPREAGCFFSASPKEKAAFVGSYLGRKTERIHVADPTKSHLRLCYWNPQVEYFVDGAVFSERVLPRLPTHDTITLGYPHGKARFGNVRIRKLNVDPPPERNDFTKSLAYYEKAIERDAQDAYAYFERGEAQKGLDHADQAIGDYKKAAELAPQWASPWEALGRVEYARGHFAETLEALRQYCRLIDDNPMVLTTMARIQSTAADDRLRDGKAAVENATKACEATQYKQFGPLEALASSYAESGNFDEAVKWATKAIEVASDARKDKCRKELDLYMGKRPLRMDSTP